jgi:hypothetical protein
MKLFNVTTMRRTALMLVPVAALLAACGANTTPPPVTAPAATTQVVSVAATEAPADVVATVGPSVAQPATDVVSLATATIEQAVATSVTTSTALPPAADAPAATQTPAELAQAWAQTITAGNIDAWVALHTPDVEFANHNWHKGTGLDPLRGWGEQIVAAKGSFKIVSTRMEGETLIWVADYTSPSFNITDQATITITNGRISRLMIKSPNP